MPELVVVTWPGYYIWNSFDMSTIRLHFISLGVLQKKLFLMLLSEAYELMQLTILIDFAIFLTER